MTQKMQTKCTHQEKHESFCDESESDEEVVKEERPT